MLPIEFKKRMQNMLGEEYDAFLAAYEKENEKSLRFNPVKLGHVDQNEKIFKTFHLKPVPWEKNGYYYEDEDQPGKHPWHEAGVYYIQEASAMVPGAFMDIRPGDKVLDLCAAPGGKSTKAASLLDGKGFLVSNEIHPLRAKALSLNIERMGIPNAIVTNETPEKLSAHFTDYFDYIIVDAPCSGEGMFRKNEDAQGEWSLENVKICAQRQDGILDQAAKMLKPGGTILYSTCTFAPEENEGSVTRFLARHLDYEIEQLEPFAGMSKGNPAWYPDAPESVCGCIRIWPHKMRGEGHFLAKLRQTDTGLADGFCKNGLEKTVPLKQVKEFETFVNETLQKERAKEILKADLYLFGDQLYQIPHDMPSIKGLKVLRPGLHLGTLKKGRFEPSHAFALYLTKKDVRHAVSLDSEELLVRAYLRGETFPCEGEKGWYLIEVDGYSLGWGKLAGQIMKNHYPKGLRKTC